MKTSDVLRKAGDVLRERGWCQGAGGNSPHSGHVCLFGAINFAIGDWRGSLYDKSDLDQLIAVTGSNTLWVWNDQLHRTVDEVLIAMDAAYVLQLQEEGIEPGDVL